MARTPSDTQRVEATTEARKAAWLDAFEEEIYVTRACKVSGVSRSTAYQWRSEDPLFAERWQEVDEANVEALEAEARRRGMHGVLEPVFFKGDEVGQIRKYSDALIMFMLKAKRPDVYRDRAHVTHAGDPAAPLQVEHTVNLKALEDDELEQLYKLVAKATPTEDYMA